MTYSTDHNRDDYTATEGQTAFAYTFRIDDADHMTVYLDGVLQGSGFAVSNVGNNNGGNVTFTTAPRATGAAAVAVTLVRLVPLSQETVLPTQGAVPTAEIEAELDRMVMRLQQQKEADDRSFRVPIGTSAFDGEITPIGGYGIKFDAAGTGLTTFPLSDISANVTVTSFGETLVNTANAQAALVQTLLYTPVLGRNLLFGADFRVAPWQRGTSFTAATTPANSDDTYLADRWVLISDGNDIVDVTKDTDGSLKATIQTANKQFGFVQIVENKNALAAIGAAVSAAMRLKASGLDKFRLAVLSWTSTADSVTSDVVTTWAGDGTEPTWATNWTREGSIIDIVPTTSYAVASGDNISISSSANNIAVVLWLDDTDGAGSDTVNVDWIGCHVGTYWAGIERRDYATELRLCQRYYWRLTPTQSAELLAGGQCNTTTQGTFDIHYPVKPMRTEPTMAATAAATFEILAGGSAVDGSSGPTFSPIGLEVAQCALTVAAGLTQGHSCHLRRDGTDTTYIEAAAEL